MEISSINELFLNHDIGFSTYLIRYAKVIQDLDKERVLFHLINCIFILIYFMPFCPTFVLLFQNSAFALKFQQLQYQHLQEHEHICL